MLFSLKKNSYILKQISDYHRELDMVKKSIFVFPLLLILITTILYLPSMNDNFLSDDYDHLMFARSVHDFPSFLKILQISGDVYRPVMNVSMTLDYLIWNYQPFGFHLTNILLFLGTSLLLYAIVYTISRNTFFAFASALIFSLFPNHHESVTWISGRTDLLATFFYLLTLYTFLQFSISKKRRWLVGAYLAAFFAYFSKEIAITLPIVIAALYLGCERKRIWTIWKKAVMIWLPFFLLFVAYLFIRKEVVGAWIGGYSLFGHSSATNIGLPFMALPYIMVKHLVNFTWLGQYIPLVKENLFTHGITLITGIVFVILAVRFNWQRIKQKSFLMNVLFLFTMLYIMTIPSASIVPAINESLMNTRVLYLASVPLSILIAYLLVYDHTKMKRARKGTLSVVCILFFLLFVINYLPWHEASDTAEAMLTSIEKLHPEYKDISYKTYSKEIFFVSLPDNTYGAYIFRNGFEEALQIAFGNKDIFNNQERKNVWIAHNKKATVTKACQFHKNSQTTGVTVFVWDQDQSMFIERTELAEQYTKRQELRERSLPRITAFNSEQWSGLTSPAMSRGEWDGLESPTLNLSPMIFSTFSFSLQAEKDGIANFSWKTASESSFSPDHTFLLPLMAGKHQYMIPLNTCPDWFLSDSIEKLKLIPTETPAAMTISDIRLE